jgi:2-amino-4-hydroxy-6-hydroxymethyldihydropteridine diphosphokinase
MNVVFLGIGGNLGNRIKNINDALKMINTEIGKITNCSSFYLTESWGFKHNKYFLNAVVEVRTKLNPNETLEQCFSIEKKLHRTRTASQNYTGRTMDIDILFFNDFIINIYDLKIPHPHLHKRNFVLYPLAEISEDLVHPVYNKKIIQLKNECNDNSKIRKIS